METRRQKENKLPWINLKKTIYQIRIFSVPNKFSNYNIQKTKNGIGIFNSWVIL